MKDTALLSFHQGIKTNLNRIETLAIMNRVREIYANQNTILTAIQNELKDRLSEGSRSFNFIFPSSLMKVSVIGRPKERSFWHTDYARSFILLVYGTYF
jgi:hypothetical protein